nr:hypothetical protein [Tanacetum cinerariifolium]
MGHGKKIEQLCESYDVAKYLRSPTTEFSESSLTPLTPEELKVDKIVLSWILFTLSDSLRARLVVARPKSAKEARSLLSEIVTDNKRSRTNALKAELRARVNDEDVVHYALEGLPDSYNSVCGSRIRRTPFPISNRYTPCKSWKPCFNFAKWTCRFGDSCRCVHDPNAMANNANKGSGTRTPSTHDMLHQLLAKLGNLGVTCFVPNTTVPTVAPVAYHTSPSHLPGLTVTPPPGFTPPTQYYYSPNSGPVSTTMAQPHSNTTGLGYTPAFVNPTVATHTNIVRSGVTSAGPSQQQQFLGSPILGPVQPIQSIVKGS